MQSLVQERFRMGNSFALWVRDTRNSKRLKVIECARRADVVQSVWSRYENDKKFVQPERATVLKIADALGVPRHEALEAAGYSTEIPTPPGAQGFLFNEEGDSYEVDSDGRRMPATPDRDEEIEALKREMFGMIGRLEGLRRPKS